MSIPDEDIAARIYLQAAESYEASDRYVDDALSWVSSHGWQHAAVVQMACDYYRESAEFATMVDDHVDGERQW